MGSGNTKRKHHLEQVQSEEIDAKFTSKERAHHNEENTNMKKQRETNKEISPDEPEKTKGQSSRQSSVNTSLVSPRDLEKNTSFSQKKVSEEKPVSTTLESTKLKLSKKGYTDERLIEHCDKTPDLTNIFILAFDSLSRAKKRLGKDNYYSKDEVSRPLGNILDSYLRQAQHASKIALGEFLVDNGFADFIKDVFLKLEADFPDVLSHDREIDSSGGSDMTEVEKAQDFLTTIIMCTINYTDICNAMNLAFNEVGLVSILVDATEKLKDCTEHQLKYMDADGTLSKKTIRGEILFGALGTLYNLSKRVSTRANFHACNAIKVVLPMIEDKVPLYATQALLLVAYLIDEENNNLIMANQGLIKFLVSLIDKANQTSDHRYLGFSNSELAEGLAQIAINDSNKKQIVASGAIPVLTNMIKEAKSEEAETAAAEALWVLAFDDENKEEMKSDKTCMDMLYKLKKRSNERAKKAASGALWEIEGKQQHSSHSTDGARAHVAMKYAATTNHVMISYQWDVQKTLIQVKDQLQAAGYRVWMDLEQMGGSTLEAMARAVENSAVVLVCVSQKYKESSNCRSEAEYAFQLKKDIIPLMMDRNYRPDGWLGMIMGSKLWIDFSQKYGKLDNSIRDLQKELGDRGKGDAEIAKVGNVDVVDAKPIIDISGWDNADVIHWMKRFGVVLKKENSRVANKLNGPVLTLLHSLRKESPDFYYSSLKDDVGLADVVDVMLFTSELEKLVG